MHEVEEAVVDDDWLAGADHLFEDSVEEEGRGGGLAFEGRGGLGGVDLLLDYHLCAS